MPTIFWLLVALTLCQFLPLSSMANPLSDALFQKGEEAFAKQQFRDALRYYKRALRADSKDPRIYVRLADVDINLDDLDSAIKYATAALTINPKTPDPLVVRAQAYFAKEQFDASLRDVNTALALDPKYWNAYWMRSKLESDKKQWHAALSDCSRAIDLRVKRDGPAGPTTMYADRAKILARLGKWSSAIEDYSRTIRYENDRDRLNRTHRDRAACYEKIGRHDLAAKDLKACNSSTQADWDIILPK